MFFQQNFMHTNIIIPYSYALAYSEALGAQNASTTVVLLDTNKVTLCFYFIITGWMELL